MSPRTVLPRILLGLLVVTSCDRLQRTAAVSTEQQQHEATVRDRVEQQLGDVPAALDTASAVRLSAAFRGAAAQALPGVVRIATITTVDVSNAPFHGNVENGPQRTQGVGSGFVFDPRGYILTNHHVVQNAVSVQVALLDGREFMAEVVGSDPNTDIAVIRVGGGEQTLPALELGDSDQLRVGDWVIALGNPLGLTFTATAGIVSAKGRSLGILLQSSGPSALESFIQTDAAINPGNSGGPLVDLSGRVVGINTAIESETGYFTGAGFAIPITLARKVASDLIEHGVVHRPRLGIEIENVSAADAEVYSLSSVSGVEVTSVTPNEAAERAGMKLGDVITTVDGQPVGSLTELQSRVALFQPGNRIQLGFIRYGTPMQATVQLGEFAPAAARPPRAEPARNGNPLGFTVTALPPALAQRLGLTGNSLPVVAQIDPPGQRDNTELLRGHVVRRLNTREIRSIAELERAASALRPGQVVSLIVVDVRDQRAVPKIVNFRIH